MKNGSLEFVSYVTERLRSLVEQYVLYEYMRNYEDMGLSIRESSKRIIELCKDRDRLKKERLEGKKMRSKIVGVGNTMDSYGDKFMSPPLEDDKKTTQSAIKTLSDQVDSQKYKEPEGKSKKKSKKAKKAKEGSGSDSDSSSSEDEAATKKEKKNDEKNKKSSKKEDNKEDKKKKDEDLIDLGLPKTEPIETADGEIDFLS